MKLEIKFGHEIAESVALPKGRLNAEQRGKKWVSLESLKAWVKKFRSSSGSEVEEYTWAELSKELKGF